VDVIITAGQECGNELFIPNIFSPNGDNVNDEWVIIVNDPNVIGVDCRVYDRWGDLVYETSDIPIVWNGKQKDQELNPGVFIYMVILKKADGTQSISSGDITLIR
jgi:gliding motility-associated-like protein